MDRSAYWWFNRLADRTPWALGTVVAYAKYGIGVFAVLLLATWLVSRRRPDAATALAGVVWGSVAALGSLALNQVVGHAVARAVELVERAEGQPLVVDVAGPETSLAALEALFTAEREEEWGEFLAECDKYEAELASEVAKQKFTLAELDEEEQSHERLRRWHRELRGRDLLGAPSAPAGERRLKECAEALEDYAQRVFQARGR